MMYGTCAYSTDASLLEKGVDAYLKTTIDALESTSLSSPIHLPDVLPIFRLLSERQAAWSDYPLYFYQNTAKPSEIYLISGWKDVPAHYEWIASEGNQELLTMFKPYVDVNDLVHLDLDFRGFKEGVGYLEVDVTREEAKANEGESSGPDRMWNGSGKDAEGKHDGIWRFIGMSKDSEGSDIVSRRGDSVMLKFVDLSKD